MKHLIIHGDCVKEMQEFGDKSIDVVVTSPPYNLNIKYASYQDNKARSEYLAWMKQIAEQFKRILKDDGSVFLNVGYTNQDPWVAMDVAQQFRQVFVLQNNITWIKHIKIDGDRFGIYKPIHSERYTTPTNESIFHFTKTGDVIVDRTSISGHYNPESGKYASSYTEAASENRHQAELKRRTAKKLYGTREWQEHQDKPEFVRLYQQTLADNPFVWNPPKDEGNSWYIPYTPISKLAKEMGGNENGLKESGRGGHPATFPIGLPENCIKFAGLNEKKIVLDPFLGTGTTLAACKKLGVYGIGIDIDEEYIAFAKARLK
jgi:site-specific DNA-methyltransferase (adenine-specific)